MKKTILLLIFALVFVFSGCQKLTPKLPEEKATTVKELLEKPENFKDVEVKLTGTIDASLDKGLVFKDEGERIRISTQSSGIDPADFLDQEVEVGGVLKEKSGEPVLEMNWVGIIPQETDQEMAEEKLGVLAKALEVEEKEIEIISNEAVDWPSSALGAPEPGKMYFQVITPGFKIIYRAQGRTYEVHTNQGGNQAVLIEPRTEL